MKLLSGLPVLLLTCGFLAFAESNADPKKEEIVRMKQEFMEEIESHINGLQTTKSCVSAVQDHEGLKKCREILEKSRAEWRKKHIDMQIKHLQEEKQKLEQSR